MDVPRAGRLPQRLLRVAGAAAEVLEGGRVGAVAGVGAVQQGQVGVGGDEQGEADDAQGGAALLAVAALGEGGLVVEGVDEGEEVGGVEEHLAQVDLEVADQADDAQGGAALLAVAALGEGGLVVEGVDEGEEVGGVEEHLAQVDLEVADQGGDEVAFDGLDGVGGDAVHVVPKALAGELGGFEREQAVEDGALEPGGDDGFGAGVEAAVEGGDEQVGADGGAWAALGDVAVDDSGELQAPGEVEEGGDGAEVADGGLGSGGGGGELEFGDDVVGATEVDLADDFGLAVDALGLAGVVVGVAADDLLDEAGHELSHTLEQI